MVLEECAADPECSAAFPNVRTELTAVLERLEEGPADATVQLRGSPDKVPVKVSRNTFAETLRMMMYSALNSRSVPLFIHQAYEGNFDPTAQQALRRNRALRTTLAMAMLHCVVCAEDIDLIDPAEIEAETGYTYFGDFRVRQQMAICDFWPRSNLPADHGEPVSVEVPVLLLSGTIDAVTPPRWGEEAASHLPNSLHVVAPGAHGVGGDCIQSIIDTFMNTGSVAGIDTSCVEDMKLAPFKLK
jgi:pimeloyl-ACP methyl ester carboxylesterase